VNAVLQIPEVKERIAKLGGDVMGGTSQDLANFLHSEVVKWQKIVPASLRH
jgi:tripartite-type tricarboxylate transporter receptor subunit TctC